MFSRRSFLQVGTLGLGGLGLADYLQLQARGDVNPAAAGTSVILFWLSGGPAKADYYACELTEFGRKCALVLATLEASSLRNIAMQ